MKKAIFFLTIFLVTAGFSQGDSCLNRFTPSLQAGSETPQWLQQAAWDLSENPFCRNRAEGMTGSTGRETYFDVFFLVGGRVEQIWVSTYGYLRLVARSDGNQEAMLKLQPGNYELRVFQEGQLKCNYPFTVYDRSLTIDFPCR